MRLKFQLWSSTFNFIHLCFLKILNFSIWMFCTNKLRPFCFLPVVRVTTAWFKYSRSVNISTSDGTTWQCCMPHCIIIHWKLCMRTIFLLCCHVPVQQGAWRKPNGLNFRNTGCQKKECCFIKFNFNPFCFPFMVSNKMNECTLLL